MTQGKFLITSSEAQSLAQESKNQTLLQLLPSLVHSTKPLARPHISNFHVCAAALGSSGRIFFGVNIEFPGLPLHHSIHAEQFLITNLILNDEPHIDFLLVSAAPCGHCRQFFQEIRNANDIKLFITDNNVDRINEDVFTPLGKFLPDRFGPYDLLDKEVPLLLEKHYNRLVLETQKGNNGMCNGYGEIFDGVLKDAALEAANMAHAPYSKCPSGVALMDCEGKIYKGFYMESAAYNPSLGPVQAALIGYIAKGGEGYERIAAAVLVEMEDAVVVQEDTARLILERISPKCEFRVFHCEFKKQ